MRYLVTALILIINLILQSTLFQYIEIFNIKPNTAIIIIVSFAFMRGELSGILIGFLVGLLQDIFFGQYIGMHAMLGMLTGFICGKFYIDFYKETFLIPLALTSAATLFYESLYYIFNILLQGYTNFFYFLRITIIPEVAYTAIFSIFIYKLMYIINSKIEEKEKFKRKLF